MSAESVIETMANAEPETDPNQLIALTLNELLAHEFLPREWLLEPAIPTQGLCMLYGPRGMGKTFVAMGIAYAVATGGEFLNFKAAKAHKVLYCDGEMPGGAMQERNASLVSTNALEPPSPEYLRVITPEAQKIPIPDFSTIEGQEKIDHLLEGVELLILDNLSCLFRNGRENEGDSWLLVQEWALSLRMRGISILFVHHSGKGGQQRGTSKREDVLDTVLALKRPCDYQASEGARFELHFEKSRGAHGEVIQPFEACLQSSGWSVKGLSESQTEKVAALFNEDLRPNEIAEELSIHKSTVSRQLKNARKMGLIT